MKNTIWRSVFATVLTLILAMSAIPLATSAASAWPSLSKSSYCEYLVPAKVDVYRDANLTTRGASNRSYNAYVDAWDVMKIYEITDNYAYISYPTSNGSRTGYVKTKSIFGVTSPKEQVVSQGKATTYKDIASDSQSGYIAKNDTVYKLGTAYKTEYTLVMYTANSGSRAYKVAFVKTSDYADIICGAGSNQQNTSGCRPEEVMWRLMQIGSGKMKYDADTVLKAGETFVGTRSSEQCKGYAKNVFNLCFGVTPGSTQKKPNNYLLNAVNGMRFVGSVTEMSDSAVRGLFQNSRPGDFVQMRRAHGGSHSAIVYKVDNNGVIFYEANTDDKNTIKKSTYTWNQLSEKNEAMSVYTASNYKLA